MHTRENNSYGARYPSRLGSIKTEQMAAKKLSGQELPLVIIIQNDSYTRSHVIQKI